MKLVFEMSELDNKTQDFIKKINYVIGAIKKDIKTLPVSPFKRRHEQLRIVSFEKLIERTAFKSFVKQDFTFKSFKQPSALPHLSGNRKSENWFNMWSEDIPF